MRRLAMLAAVAALAGCAARRPTEPRLALRHDLGTRSAVSVSAGAGTPRDRPDVRVTLRLHYFF
jgi:hypothetical protein